MCHPTLLTVLSKTLIKSGKDSRCKWYLWSTSMRCISKWPSGHPFPNADFDYCFVLGSGVHRDREDEKIPISNAIYTAELNKQKTMNATSLGTIEFDSSSNNIFLKYLFDNEDMKRSIYVDRELHFLEKN